MASEACLGLTDSRGPRAGETRWWTLEPASRYCPALGSIRAILEKSFTWGFTDVSSDSSAFLADLRGGWLGQALQTRWGGMGPLPFPPDADWGRGRLTQTHVQGRMFTF